MNITSAYIMTAAYGSFTMCGLKLLQAYILWYGSIKVCLSITVINLKFELLSFIIWQCAHKILCGNMNSADPGQTTTEGAVWFGSAIFAIYTCMGTKSIQNFRINSAYSLFQICQFRIDICIPGTDNYIPWCIFPGTELQALKMLITSFIQLLLIILEQFN